jgi:transposase InsO family protein
MSRISPNSRLVLSTPHYAFATGVTPLIFHPEQGTEFMAQRYIDFLGERGIQDSINDVASPWQNGFVESIKHELGDVNWFESVRGNLPAHPPLKSQPYPTALGIPQPFSLVKRS